MDKLRVGFIGAGRISDLHAIEYLRNPRAAIVAVCDADPAVAARQARAWGVPEARTFTGAEDLLAVDEVDLVEVLLPHHLHAPVTLAALRAGKRVSVQKPMATSLADAEAMVAAADAAGLFFKLFENFVFYPPVVKAKELVDAGAIGEPLFVRIKSNFGNPGTAGRSPSRRATGGSTPSAAAAGRSCSTTATTSSRSPGGSWACPRRSTPGSAPRRSRAASWTGRPYLLPLPGRPHGRVRGGALPRPAGRDAPLRAGRPESRSPARRASSGSPAATARSATGRR